jgi:hypothetical protein
MGTRRRWHLFAFTAWLAALSTPAAASCGSAFCTIATTYDALGIRVEPGFRLDVRGDYVDQNILRSGTNKVGPQGIPDTHDEVGTINRNLVATLDYSWSPNWGVSVLVPYVSRSHDHVFNDPVEGPEPESWSFNGFGDVKVIGRYQINNASGSAFGVRLGLTLPTGSFNEVNAEGERAERTLAPGTGTTQLIAGLYGNGWFGTSSLGYFASATVQTPLNNREDFRPGTQFAANAGLSYPVATNVALLLQVNALVKWRDSGLQAEPEDSGSRQVFVSPGINITVVRNLFLYGFVQLPIYQSVNGTQLTADWAAVAGISKIW